ncbi:hypothetical protein ACEWY4_005321 [Coilia grayii]|uniref:Transcriptional regulating factor 1 n=1 Tax=Coilia grayii TaxID=363190 RepID=A0ABD1KIM3_9TELE
MTDQQLFEVCHMTNGTDGGYMPSHSAPFSSLSYGPLTLSSLNNSPVSPHITQEALKSPITPCNDLSPLVDMPKGGGPWLSNHLGRNTPNPWMSSGQSDGADISNQVNQHPRMYPFAPFSLMNSEVSSKPHGGALQRLDSFTQAFPNQNLGLLRSNSLSTDNGSPSGLEDGPMLLSPQQAGSPIDHPPLYSQSAHRFNQLLMNPGQPVDQLNSPLLGQPQSQYDYPPQQQAGHVTEAQQMYHSQHHSQQPSQGFPRPRFLSLQGLHQSVHSQLQGSYLQPNERKAQDTHYPPPSPQPFYGQNCKGLEQQISFTSVSHQPPSFFSESQPYLHLPPHQNSFQLPQAQMLADSHHALGSKHHRLDRQNSGSLSSPVAQGLSCSSPLDRVGCVDYSSAQSQRDSSHCCLPPHHPTSSRRDLQLSHNSAAMQLPQIIGGTGFLPDPVSPHCMPRAEMAQRKPSGSKLKCSVCQREFKSLPALNGHMRSHGGFKTQPPTTRIKEEPQEFPPEVASAVPMVMPVSVPVKKPPSTPIRFSPAPQFSEMSRDPEHQAGLYSRAMCGQRTVSPSTSSHLPPLQIPTPEPQRDSGEEDESRDARPHERKRYQHRLLPLFIPSPSPFPVARGAVLFRSQLRSPGPEGDAPYTPPPMLSPARPGSGLFSSVCGGGDRPGLGGVLLPAQVHLCKTGHHPSLKDDLHGRGHIETPGQGTPMHIEPRINIGKRFQAEIPHLCIRSEAAKDPHRATLVWSSWSDLNIPYEQQKVDDLLRLACCSVLPGGGTNTELALHCLFQCKGDVMATVEKLLMSGPTTRATSKPLADYHYAGSDKWTVQEQRQLNRALEKHHKDFFLVQKMVRTKTVAQCVEFYYTWKRRCRSSRRLSANLTTPATENEVNWEEYRMALSKPNGLEKKCSTDFADCSESLTASLGYEELSNISAPDGDGETLSQAGRRSRPPAERGLPQSGQHTAGPASVKSSPAHSTTSGETDTTLAFPCRECGKVFFKVKSRNAHMKTHRQQEASLCWPVQMQRPLEDGLDMTPASPYRSPSHLLLLPGNHISGPQGTQIEDVGLYRDEGQPLNPHLIQNNSLG